MPEYKRKFSGVFRYLIESISMITMKRLSFGADSVGVVSTLPDGVKSARLAYYSSPNGETALFLDDQRRGLTI